MTKVLTYIEIDLPDFGSGSPEPDTTYRFTKDVGYLPTTIEAIASLKSVSYSPSRISIGKNLGERASLTVTFSDHKHVFNGESFDSGTFWGKWRARYGQKLRGYELRWITGTTDQDIEDMTTYYFIIDSVDGPNSDGTYTITAKDVLKLADGDRAQAPLLSRGYALDTIAVGAGSFTLSPSGIGNLDYPASGHVAIGGEEICSFTRSGDTMTITRAQLGTTAVEHSAGDKVQLVLRYDGDDPADIIYDLLTTYCGVNGTYIDLEEWQLETATYLGRALTGNIAEPTSVRTLISEIIEQSGLILWWDPLDQLIKLQVIRPISTTADTFSDGNILEGTLKAKDQPNLRISQIWVYFAIRDPLKALDEAKNYRSVEIVEDADSELDYGSAAIHKIFSRWIPFGGREVASRIGEIILSRYVDPPRRFTFSTYKFGDITPVLGGGYQLRPHFIQEQDGTQSQTPIQVTRLNPGEAVSQVEAEEFLMTYEDQVDPNNRLIIIDSNISNINLRTLHDQLYPEPVEGQSPTPSITFRILTNVVVSSTSTSTPACTVGTWPDGFLPVVQVLGRIEGAGGAGASGIGASRAGSNGGVALYTTSDIVLDLSSGYGRIWGGGGGGASYYHEFEEGTAEFGGGGGAGVIAGNGGAGGEGYEGDAGGYLLGGDGGSLHISIPFKKEITYYAGDGGDAGQDGHDSYDSTAGGTAGLAIDGISHVTKIGTGDIRGDEDN